MISDLLERKFAEANAHELRAYFKRSAKAETPSDQNNKAERPDTKKQRP